MLPERGHRRRAPSLGGPSLCRGEVGQHVDRGRRCPPSARRAGCRARTSRAPRRSRAPACPGAGSPAAGAGGEARRSGDRGTCTASRRRSRRRVRRRRRRRAGRGARRPRRTARRRPWATAAMAGHVGPGADQVGRGGHGDEPGAVGRPGRPTVGRGELAGRGVEGGPPHGGAGASAASTQGRMLASWSSRVTTTSSPGPQSCARVRARSKVSWVGAAAEDDAARVGTPSRSPTASASPARRRRRCARPRWCSRGWTTRRAAWPGLRRRPAGVGARPGRRSGGPVAGRGTARTRATWYVVEVNAASSPLSTAHAARGGE